MSETDFTRSRKQSFSSTLLLMINRITKSLSIEILNFVQILQRDLKYKHTQLFSKSAFVKYRQKMRPEVFMYLSKVLTDEYFTDNDASVRLWRGFRLLAVDGSSLTLPNTKELKNEFGVANNQTQTSITQGRASVLYDVLNEFVIDASLSPVSIGERALATQHLECTKSGDLVIYDRGYPSILLMYQHLKKGVDFLIRTKADFSNFTKEFVQSKKQTQIVEVTLDRYQRYAKEQYPTGEVIKIRLNKVILDDGTIEILMSSLLDLKKYNNSVFKDLYFMRWGIETYYDELKNKLKVECFSGYSKTSIMQDFYASILVSNIQSLLIDDLNEELSNNRDETKYRYKINANMSYGILKNRILDIFLAEKEMDDLLVEIKDLLRMHTVPIRLGRKFNRNVGKYRRGIRPRVTGNVKDTF